VKEPRPRQHKSGAVGKLLPVDGQSRVWVGSRP
jgi:hypothetical protein